MNLFKSLVLVALAGICFTVAAPKAAAQVSVAVGVAPDCPYGYYDTTPYGCAPYGYYGSEWVGCGDVIGARPAVHGSCDSQGHVNNRLQPYDGYMAPAPQFGEKAEPSKRVDKVANFKGNEVRDGRGHT